MTTTDFITEEEFNGVQYSKKKRTDNRWTDKFKVMGDHDDDYTVSYDARSETWGCSCPGWIFHKEKNCKHIDRVLHLRSHLDKLKSTHGCLWLFYRQDDGVMHEAFQVQDTIDKLRFIAEKFTGVKTPDWIIDGWVEYGDGIEVTYKMRNLKFSAGNSVAVVILHQKG